MGFDTIEINLVVIVVVTLENKVNSEPDLFKFVHVGFQVGLEFDNIQDRLREEIQVN